VAVFTVSEVTALWWGRGARYYIMLIIIIEWWLVWFYLERGANDLHMVRLMPLPPCHLLLR